MTVLLLGSGPGSGIAGGGASAAHRYWRFIMNAGVAAAYAFSEVQFRTTAGVSLAFSGGTASAGQTFGGTPGANDASKAADGNISTLYSSSDKTGSQWWAYDYGVGNALAIMEIAITARNDGSFNQAPSNFRPQWSDDGTSWTSMTSIAANWTAAGQVQLFPVTAIGFTTFNGIATDMTLSNGNLTATHNVTSISPSGVRSASLINSGKYYFEITYGASHGNSDGFGILMSTATYTNQNNGQSCFTIFTNFGPGAIYSDSGLVLSSLGSFTAGDVVCFAIDLTNLKAWIRKNNGNWNNSGTANPATNTGGLTLTAASYAPSIAFGNTGSVSGDNATANFGQIAYAFPPPSGFGNWPP